VRAGEVLKGNSYAWEVKLDWFSLMSRIQIDPNVSDTRILFSTYPVFLVRPGYVSKAYLTRIRVQYVSDTGYGPPGVSAHHRRPWNGKKVMDCFVCLFVIQSSVADTAMVNGQWPQCRFG
jgi:hypothetical protein